MVACKAVYEIHGVEFTVPVLLLPIVAGTAWERFASARNFSGTFPAALSIGLPLIDAQAMSTLWDALIPPKYFRNISNLANIIAQLDGHARSVEYFIAFVLGLNSPELPTAMNRDSLIGDLHKCLEKMSRLPGALLSAFSASVFLLMIRYGGFNDAGTELLAAVVTHCPVSMRTVLDGHDVESFLDCSPLTVARRPDGMFYLNMPLSLLAARAAQLNSVLSKKISSVMKPLLDDQLLGGTAFEVFSARHLALVLEATRLLPAELRDKPFSDHYPNALLLAGAEKVKLSATSSTVPIAVRHCEHRFPATLDLRDSKRRALTPDLVAGTCVVVNASGAPFVDTFVFTSKWRVWMQCKGFAVSEVTAPLFAREERKLAAGLVSAHRIDTAAHRKPRRDVFVVVSQGRGVGLSTATCTPSMPSIVVCRNHGFEEFFHIFSDCASLSTTVVSL